jgi:hypothetical protein
MSALPKKQAAPVASEGGELGDQQVRPRFSTPSVAELQENHLQALEQMAAWREDLTTRLRRSELKFQLIGLDQEEQDKLAAESDEFGRCCRVLGWRP